MTRSLCLALACLAVFASPARAATPRDVAQQVPTGDPRAAAAATEARRLLGDGERAWAKDKVAEAIVAWSRARSAFRAAGDLRGEASASANLGHAFRRVHRYSEARRAYASAAELADKAGDARGRALGGIDLGGLELDAGRLDAALASYRRASEALGGKDALSARAEEGAGTALAALGRYEEAEKSFKAALERDTEHKDTLAAAEVLLHLAGLERNRGRARSGMGWVTLAAETTRGKASPGLRARIASTRGELLLDLGRPDEALTQLDLATSLAEEAFDFLALAHGAVRAASAALGAHGPGAAVKRLDGLYRRLAGKPSTPASTRLVLGTALSRALGQDGRNEAAAGVLDGLPREVGGAPQAVLARASLALASNAPDRALSLLDGHPATAWPGGARWQWHALRAASLMRTGRAGEADKDAGAALVLLGDVSVRERAVRAPLLGLQVEPDLAARVASEGALRRGDQASGLKWAEAGRRLASGAEAAGEWPEGLRTAIGRLQAAEEALFRVRAATGVSPEEAEVLRHEVDARRAEFSTYVDTLRGKDPSFDRLVGIAPESIEAYQSHLPTGVALLEPVLLEDRVVLLGFTRTAAFSAEHVTPRDEVEQRARSYRATFDKGDEKALAAVKTDAHWLYDRLVGPISQNLNGIDTILVAPAGMLRALPFAALHDGNKWLVERYDLVFLSTIATIARTPRRTPLDLLAIGNPDGTLPGAESEVRTITAALPGARALYGAEATTTRFLESARGRSALHLATHAILVAGRPLASHIVMGGKGLDARIGYREIPGLASYLRSVRLVVLSACSTALGARGSGGALARGEVEIAGIYQQFRRAGVDSVVGTLWEVDDDASAKLMPDLYRRLHAGESRAKALAGAQRALLADAAHLHPFFWAPYALHGEWRPL